MHTDKTSFISLADLLRAQASAPVQASRDAVLAAATTASACFASPPGELPVLPAAAATVPLAPRESPADEYPQGLAAIRAARLFHAALADMFDTFAALLGHELAREVLSRELHTSPADVTALARKLIVERWTQEPLRVRVAPADAAIVCELPVVADPSLQPGDAILECRGGEIDARLTIRLAAVVARLAP